jgi:hypothetical protein
MKMLPVAAVAALAACTGASGSRPDVTDEPAAASSPVVPLVTRGSGPAHVRGGTPAMRARAHAILAGMGDTAIVEVRFGRPPSTFVGLRDVPGPIWLAMTVRAPATPFSHRIRQALRADGPLWQASVFENAYLGSQPPGAPRVRGTSERFSVPGRGITLFESGTASKPRYTGLPPSERSARAVIARAAEAARFRIASVAFIHPGRPAATVVVRAAGRESFPRRYTIFHNRLSALAGRLAGLQWRVVDRCGSPVVVHTAGTWARPRWLCPNPFVLGLIPVRACPKHLRPPPCGG